MVALGGFEARAVCDIDEKRLEAAQEDFPGIETYKALDKMLEKSDIDMVVVILPHSLHAWAGLKALEAGKHTVIEKPFALTIKECDRMIEMARRKKVMLSVYHNRHWDSNILTIMKHIKKIGRPYRWESLSGGYGEPRKQWRTNKRISGGIVYDWGAHFVEWMLQAMPYRMKEISGFKVNEVWKNVTNEDEVEVVVRFEGDAVGSHIQSSISLHAKPPILIVGTKGAITAGQQSVTVHTIGKSGERISTSVSMVPSQWEKYYRNIRDHILYGKELIITAEWARRVIQVLDLGTRSAHLGRALKAIYP